jgi:hypothetical protein
MKKMIKLVKLLPFERFGFFPLWMLGLMLWGNCSFAQNDGIIGQMQNGQPVITVSVSQLILNFSCNLMHISDLETDFTDADIVGNELDGYYLHFFGGNYVSNIRLVVEADGDLVTLKTSCTTSACPSEVFGCTPDVYGACRPCNNKGKCTKTVSQGFLVASCD